MAGDYYTGFVADHYDLLVPEDETRSYGLFRSVIESDGQPALELACGTGRPLLTFVADGLEVEGLDSSPDMLRRCAAKASDLRLSVRLHEQRMESFEIDRASRTIYCTSSSFQLLQDDEAVRRALSTIGRHLFLLHWHTQDQFAGVLAGAGYVDIQALRGNGKASQATDRLFVFSARIPT